MAMISSIHIWLSLLITCGNLIAQSTADTERGVFILGDSTADVGTNNYITSKFKANFPPNGVDFPNGKSTGRFSNGFNSADELAKLFSLDMSPPPFLYLLTLGSRFQEQLQKGVSFASAGAGILDITNCNNTVPLSEQINQFTTVRNNLTAMLGEPATQAMMNNSLFFITIGSNDIFDYFGRKDTTPPQTFISMMISTYSHYIQTLYGLGARRFGITSVAPVGCCPFSRLVQLNYTGTNGCFPPMNDFAESFHLALDGLLLNISSQLPGMKYALGNTFNMTLDVIKAPRNSSFFGVVDSACCGRGALNAEGPCDPKASFCEDRDNYLFWDKFHPSQYASFLAAEALYYSSFYVSPIPFSQLAQD